MNYSGVKKFFEENKKYSILTESVTDKQTFFMVSIHAFSYFIHQNKNFLLKNPFRALFSCLFLWLFILSQIAQDSG
ncbi:hypothetical protein ERG27_01320 [Bacillus amyloliquefaciens]|nr:hypothetical protein BCBMB205_04940 [Bacillus velezensis]APQ50230.1 hypothetical protein BSO20_09325 [Bacillus amyloliquefaciens]QJC40964.1 hypothetical protein FHJ82_02640 [Bacillus sp. HNA3]ANS37322.1 hypothetical protein A5891_02585 [Bacillus velezensis]ANU29080.1 hypothetical protein A8142_02435 [Bacillus velezensis]